MASFRKVAWKERMCLCARVRMWGERLLLSLPSWLVFSLLMRVHYREAAPGRCVAAVPAPAGRP